MGHQVCFRSSDGTEICIPLYVEIKPRWVDPNPPDPGPWDIIAKLGTISQLAETLTQFEPARELQEVALRSLQEAVSTFAPEAALSKTEMP